MSKKPGFIVTATYFIPIDKKDFKRQAATYAAMSEIEATGKLPEDFDGTLIAVKAKQGSADVPEAE